jgi:endonuclease G
MKSRLNKNLSIFIYVVLFLIGCATTYQTAIASSQEKTLTRDTEHIIYGYPSTSGTVLYRKGYVLDHDSNKKVAVWASYHLTDKYLIQKVKRTDDFRPDPDLPKGQRSELVDYTGSGYDRGHLVPADDMRRDKQTESETFLLSNMTPQVGAGFNNGIWKSLEIKIRDKWAKKRKNLYVITGPIYETPNYKTIGPNKVAVPTAFYKIVVSCAPNGENLDAIAFIIPNKSIPSKRLPYYISTIDEVEKETGLDFLRNLRDDIENTLEAKRSVMW